MVQIYSVRDWMACRTYRDLRIAYGHLPILRPHLDNVAMSAQTHEERLREMALDTEIDCDCEHCEERPEALHAGATALAITREIAEMTRYEVWTTGGGGFEECFFCRRDRDSDSDERELDIVHEPNCLYLKALGLHARR